MICFQVNAAKRDAFFKGSELSAAPKFDPSTRYVADRERIRERDPPPKDIEVERGREKNNDTHKELEGYVGFANLPNQVYRKSVKIGFEFTLMVVGKFELV